MVICVFGGVNGGGRIDEVGMYNSRLLMELLLAYSQNCGKNIRL